MSAELAPCNPRLEDSSCDSQKELDRYVGWAAVLTLFGVPGVSLVTSGVVVRKQSIDRFETVRPGPVSGATLELRF